MNSLFYLAMLIGIGWLMIWVILPPEQRGKGWWPFDMRDGEAPHAAAESARRGRAGSRADRANPEPSPAVVAEAPKTEGPASAAPVSWRARRDKAQSSRRGA